MDSARSDSPERTLSDALRARRRASGWNQDEAASHLGVPQQTYAHWEAGTRPRNGNPAWTEIAVFLDMSEAEARQLPASSTRDAAVAAAPLAEVVSLPRPGGEDLMPDDQQLGVTREKFVRTLVDRWAAGEDFSADLISAIARFLGLL